MASELVVLHQDQKSGAWALAFASNERRLDGQGGKVAELLIRHLGSGFLQEAPWAIPKGVSTKRRKERKSTSHRELGW